MSINGKGAELPARPHALQMENRKKLRLTGVSDVSGLSVRGEELHIDKIDLDAGLLELRGKICELCYEETPAASGLWKKIFG